MCLTFLNSYVCRIVFSADICAYREQLSRRGTTLRSHHWSDLLSKDWQIIPLDYPRRRRPHNLCTAHQPDIYIFAPVHTCAYRVGRWLYGYATCIHIHPDTNTHKYTRSRMRCGNAIAAQSSDGRGAPRAIDVSATRVKPTASRSVTHFNRARVYMEGDDSEITALTDVPCPT